MTAMNHLRVIILTAFHLKTDPMTLRPFYKIVHIQFIEDNLTIILLFQKH